MRRGLLGTSQNRANTCPTTSSAPQRRVTNTGRTASLTRDQLMTANCTLKGSCQTPKPRTSTTRDQLMTAICPLKGSCQKLKSRTPLLILRFACKTSKDHRSEILDPAWYDLLPTGKHIHGKLYTAASMTIFSAKHTDCTSKKTSKIALQLQQPPVKT